MGDILIKVLGIVLLFLVSSSQADDSIEIQSGRKHGFFPPFLLIPFAYGTVAVLVIIKLVLAFSFVGAIIAFLHIFLKIKKLDLFKSIIPAEPLPHHSHEYDEEPYYYHHPHSHEYPYHTGPEIHSRWQQVYDGGRGLKGLGGGDSVKEIKERNRRNLEKILNSDNKNAKRVVRSAEAENDNCKMRKICEIHARAKLSPFHTFQLYFIKKDGLAQYWDHVDRPYRECALKFPCGKGAVTKITETKPEQNKIEITKVNERQGKQYSYDSYSAEPETDHYSSYDDTYDYNSSK